MKRDPYFLGYSVVEQQRLQQQARDLAEESRLFFEQIGVPTGAHVVEIGCGPQGCLGLLADRVGPTGTVVGVEMSEHAVELARRFAAAEKLANVEVRHGNGKATGLPRASFDLATARLVLVNIPEPEHVVAEMVALVRSGGVVALHEADWGMVLCDPPLPAWDTIIRAFLDYSAANGIDHLIGRRIARLLRTSGLMDVRINPLVHVYDVNHSRRTLLPEFARNLRDRIVASGIVSEQVFESCHESLEHHLADPDTLVIWTYFQAWATKP
jgi:ubiquinone/menaquinone biosynthesis C-methylase UbiE